jgi:ribosomal protein S3
LGKYIAMQLKMIKKHWSFTRILTKLLDEYWFKYSNQVRGCKIVFIGKFNGSSRTRKVSLKFGEFNIHRFTSKVDYSLSESFSLFGIFGIKIWIQAY